VNSLLYLPFIFMGLETDNFSWSEELYLHLSDVLKSSTRLDRRIIADCATDV
jgi:hypothetical protein